MSWFWFVWLISKFLQGWGIWGFWVNCSESGILLDWVKVFSLYLVIGFCKTRSFCPNLIRIEALLDWLFRVVLLDLYVFWLEKLREGVLCAVFFWIIIGLFHSFNFWLGWLPGLWVLCFGKLINVSWLWLLFW